MSKFLIAPVSYTRSTEPSTYVTVPVENLLNLRTITRVLEYAAGNAINYAVTDLRDVVWFNLDQADMLDATAEECLRWGDAEEVLSNEQWLVVDWDVPALAEKYGLLPHNEDDDLSVAQIYALDGDVVIARIDNTEESCPIYIWNIKED